MSADNSVPYRVMGAMQDLGTASGPSHSLSAAGITAGHWYTRRRRRGRPRGGRSRATRPSSTPASTSASSPATTAAPARPATSRAWPDNPSGHGASFPRYRFQWTAPIAVSPHDPKTVYHGGNVLFRTQRRRPELDRDQRRPDARRQDEAAVVRRADHRRQHRRRVLLHDLRDRGVAARGGADLGRAPTTGSSTSRATAARPGRT